MNKREELILIQDEILTLNNQIEKLRHLKHGLEKKSESLIILILEEEQLLANSKWELVSETMSPHLKYRGLVNDDLMSKINKLAVDGCHSPFSIEKGIDVIIDDDKITIYFDDLKKIPDFVKTHQMVIDLQPIRGRLQNLKEDVLELEMVCHNLLIV